VLLQIEFDSPLMDEMDEIGQIDELDEIDEIGYTNLVGW
jgi:hypothetical protein